MNTYQHSRIFLREIKVLQQLTRNLILPGNICKGHLRMLSSSCHKPWLFKDRTYVSTYSFCDTSSQTKPFQQRGLSHVCYRQSYLLGNICSSKNWTSLSACDNVLRRHISLSTKSIVEGSPRGVQPYLKLLRFDKPIGTYLLFWPCSWSIGLAAQAGHLPDLYLLGLFALGSFIMRGSGCIINDMWDREYDKRVERTKTRPLASGDLSPFQALVFLGGNLSIALGILLQLNWYSVFLGAASMILVISYPLAKRYTYWPQAVLGITLNWGVLLAWSALHGSLELPVLPLYVACALNTMFYDTIYSHQDKYDDMLIGVKSTALKFGDQTKVWLTGFASMMIGCLSLTGYLCDQTWPYYAAVAATGMHMTHQLYTVDLNNPDDCLKKFKSNTHLGAILFFGIMFGTLLKGKEEKREEKSN